MDIIRDGDIRKTQLKYLIISGLRTGQLVMNV